MLIEQVKELSAFDRLVYWIRERESVRRKKEAGEPLPWTDDIILQRFRFTNVRRMDDRVSKWLLESWYKPYKNHPNLLAAVALARFVNLPSSLAGLEEPLFRPELRTGKPGPDWRRIKKLLRARKPLGPVFNAAYMVRGNDGVDKIESVVDYNVRPLVEKTRPTIDPRSMEKTWGAIRTGYGLGSFMAGQITADLRWALDGTWADRMTWSPVGPGSSKGLGWTLYGVERDNAAREFVAHPERFTAVLTEELIPRLCKALPRPITYRLEAHDYQSCCCEIGKYNRVLFGEGRPKQLYRGGV